MLQEETRKNTTCCCRKLGPRTEFCNIVPWYVHGRNRRTTSTNTPSMHFKCMWWILQPAAVWRLSILYARPRRPPPALYAAKKNEAPICFACDIDDAIGADDPLSLPLQHHVVSETMTPTQLARSGFREETGAPRAGLRIRSSRRNITASLPSPHLFVDMRGEAEANQEIPQASRSRFPSPAHFEWKWFIRMGEANKTSERTAIKCTMPRIT